MAYAVVAEIASELRRTIDATTDPSTTEVSAIIDQVTDEINGVARKAGYKVPFTDAESLNIVKGYCIMGTCWRVENIIFADASPNQSPRAELWYQAYQNGLKMVRGRLVVGAQAMLDSDSPVLMRSYQVSNPSADGVGAVITREMKL